MAEYGANDPGIHPDQGIRPDNYYLDPSDHPEAFENSMQYILDTMKNRGLDRDTTKNIINTVGFAAILGPDTLKKAERYEARVWNNAMYREGAELILQLSDAKAVAELNAHIDAFNARVDRIITEKNIEEIRAFVSKAFMIMEKYNTYT